MLSFCYIYILLCSIIFKYIYLVHHAKEKNEKKTKICEELITERSDDKDEEFIQLTVIVKDETKLDFALTNKKCLDLLLELSGIVQKFEERRSEAMKHVL